MATLQSLTSINIERTNISSIDFSDNNSAVYIFVPNNKITSLTLPTNKTLLEQLHVYGNNIGGTLDISSYIRLTRLDCTACGLTQLILPTSITTLACGSNTFTGTFNTSSIPTCISLNIAGCGYNNIILDNDNGRIELLYINGNPVNNINLTNYDLLRELNISNTSITDIDLTYNTMLNKLYISGCNISTLSLASNTNIQNIECSGCNLSSLDVSACSSLNRLIITTNRLIQSTANSIVEQLARHTTIGGTLHISNQKDSFIDTSNTADWATLRGRGWSII